MRGVVVGDTAIRASLWLMTIVDHERYMDGYIPEGI
jgi:hypothetical protein